MVTVASAPSAAVSTATTTIPAACAFLIAGPIALGSPGVQQDQVDAGGDEIVDLGDLLAEVVFEADRGDLHIGIGLLGLELGALRQRDEERVAQRAERNADRLELLGEGRRGA
ncbi:hypothetical protein ACVIHC_002549 [Bradyrhizobium diazoefficiens]